MEVIFNDISTKSMGNKKFSYNLFNLIEIKNDQIKINIMSVDNKRRTVNSYHFMKLIYQDCIIQNC